MACVVLGKNARSEFFHLPLDLRRTESTAATTTTNPLKAAMFSGSLCCEISHLRALSLKSRNGIFPKGQKNDANYGGSSSPLPFSHPISPAPKSLLLLCYLSPLVSLSRSGTEVIIYVSKNPSTFSVPPGASPPPPVVVFPLKLFVLVRPAAQFSWVLFIPRDKGRERKKASSAPPSLASFFIVGPRGAGRRCRI